MLDFLLCGGRITGNTEFLYVKMILMPDISEENKKGGKSPVRKIIHIDMDAFFASVEQLDHPEWRNKPVIVGGPADKRGVVSTCSYEARAFGVHSAMPMARAQRLCPQGIFVSGNMRRYCEISDRIREIFLEITPLVEPLSIDEAFLDVTCNNLNCRSATLLAGEIRRRIYTETGLTASAGVSFNKFLAKVASGMRKPAGLTVITPEKALPFLDSLPVEKFYGIGKVTAGKLRRMNIKTGRELKELSLETLVAHFGKAGAFYYDIVRGRDDRPVEPGDERKSVGRENTYARDIADPQLIRIHVRSLARKVARSLQKLSLAGKTVTLKVRYDNFQTVTRSASFHLPMDNGEAIGEVAAGLLAKTEAFSRPVRLLGVTVSNFPDREEAGRPVQLLFDF